MGKLTYTATGNVASFKSMDDLPFEHMKVTLPVVQAGTGNPDLSNIREITPWTECVINHAGRNLLDDDNVGWVSKYFINEQGVVTSSSSYKYTSEYIPVLPNTTYTFSLKKGTSNTAISVCKYTADKTFTERVVVAVSSSVTYQYGSMTMDADTRFIRFSCRANATDVQIEYGSTPTEYKAYSSNTIPVSWQSTVSDVYIGELDVITGVLTTGYACKILNGTETWVHLWGDETANGVFRFAPKSVLSGAKSGTLYVNFAKNATITSYNIGHGIYMNLSSNYLNIRNSMSAELGNSTHEDLADAWKAYLAEKYANNTPFIIVYPIETPVSYQLTATQVKSKIGDNNIWSDIGTSIEAEYQFIDHLALKRGLMLQIAPETRIDI